MKLLTVRLVSMGWSLAILVLSTCLLLGCGARIPNTQDGNDSEMLTISAKSDDPRDWIKQGEYYDHFADLNEPILAIPETERAWPKYREVLPKLEGLDEWAYDATLPEGANWNTTVQYLDGNRENLDQLVDTARLPQLGFLLSANVSNDDALAFDISVQKKRHQPRLIETVLLATSKLGPAVHVMNAAAREAATRSDGEAALKYHQAAMSICQHLQQQPSAVAQVVAAESTIDAFTAVRIVMQDHPRLWNDQQLNELKLAIENHQLASMGLTIEFDGFRSIIDAISHIRNDRQRIEQLLSKLGTRLPEASEEIDFLEGLKTQCLTEYSKGIWERTGWSPSTDLTALSQSEKMFLTTRLFPALEPLYYLNEIAQQERNAALVTAGIQIFHNRNGRWPQELTELTPAILATVPLDRFDGQPFRYAYSPEEVTLYSVSANGIEDPGNLKPIPTSVALAQWLAEDTAAAERFSSDWLLWTSRAITTIQE